MMETKGIIKCPYCGAEYMPSEVYFPEDLLDGAFDITKSESGKIEHTLGEMPKYEEEYTCDYCNHTFKVECHMGFVTDKCDIHDFGNDYKSPVFNEDRMELKEEND